MKPNTIKVTINEGHHWTGDYIAYQPDVDTLLATHGKRDMIRLAMDYWPEICASAEARKQLRAFPAYVLAVMLRQQ